MTRGQLFTQKKEKALSPLVEVRLGRRTKVLAQTLTPGCLVVLDHPDLDAVAAQMLLRVRPFAVVNCQAFVTGRYPNRGPGVLLDAGIPLYEAPDSELFTLLKDGERLSFGQPLPAARCSPASIRCSHSLRRATNAALRPS